jgi:hypothetical protein
MRAEELTAEFGITGILDFVDAGELTKAVITLDGMRGELYLQGAQLTAWQPRDQRPVLLLAPTARSRQVGQFVAASQLSSHGLVLAGTCGRRPSTVLPVPPHGVSTAWRRPGRNL